MGQRELLLVGLKSDTTALRQFVHLLKAKGCFFIGSINYDYWNIPEYIEKCPQKSWSWILTATLSLMTNI